MSELLFGKPKELKMPPVPPTPAAPEVTPEAEEEVTRRARRRAGFRKTLITGALEPEMPGKKQLLGG